MRCPQEAEQTKDSYVGTQSGHIVNKARFGFYKQQAYEEERK